MLKKLSLFLGLLFIASNCSTIDRIPGYTSYYFLNLKKHSEQGFFVTPEPPTGNYQPIGLIQVEVKESAQFKTEIRGNDLNGNPKYSFLWVKDTVNLQETVDSLVSLARALGANSLTRFKAQAQSEYPIRGSNGEVEGPAIRTVFVSGFAVKRENN